MKKLFTALASAVFLLVSASAFAGQPTPLTMQIDRTQDPSPVCLYRLTSGTCILIGTISSSGVWSPTAAILHVANVDALKAFQNYDVSVRRDGFATPGDGGDATYVHSSAACTITKNGNPGDDGAQVVDAAGTGCWLADLSKPISAAVWGVKSDDAQVDGPYWLAAATAMGASQGDIATLSNKSGVLLFPQTNGTCSKLTSTLLLNVSSLTIRGAGPRPSCFDLQFATGNGVQFGDSSHYALNNTIEHVGFRSDAVHRTSGNSLAVWNQYYFNADDVGCYDYFYSCFGVDQTVAGNDYNFNHVFTSGTNGVTGGAGVFGFTIGANTTPGSATFPNGGPVEVRITNSELAQLGYNGTQGAALNLLAVGGLITYGNNTDFNYQAAWVHPPTGLQVSGWISNNNNWDTSTQYNLFADTTGGGKFTNSAFRGDWMATAGSSSNPTPNILFQGPTGSIENIDMDFGQLFSAWGNGVVLKTGNDIKFSGHIGGNGLASLGIYHGIVVQPPSGVAVQDLSIDARIGGSFGADAILPTNIQNCAVFIAGGGGSVINVVGKGDWSGNRNSSGVCDSDTADLATHDFSGTFPGAPSNTYACTVGSTTAGASNGSCSITYRVSGATVNFEAAVVEGSTDTGSGAITFTLPTNLPAPAAQSLFSGRNQGSGAVVSAFVDPAVSTTTGLIQTAAGSYPGAANASFRVKGSYRIAQ